MTKEHEKILRHTRDRAAHCMYCGDSKAMQELVDMGLMKSAGCCPGVPDEYFTLTQEGRDVINAMDKLKTLKGTAKLKRKITKELIRGALARGYCSVDNENKVLDPKLLDAQVEELCKVLGVEK